MNNVDLTYHELLKDIISNGTNKMDRTNVGTRSVFGRMVKFDMREGFPLLTTKKIHTKSVIHELLWFLKGDTNIKYLNANGVTIWDEWADEDGNLGPVYGKQWVDWGGYDVLIEGSNPRIKHRKGINQIQYVIDRLTNYPDCRRIMVNAWNVGELDQMKLMPCHYGFQFWTRELTLDERQDWCVANRGLFINSEFSNDEEAHKNFDDVNVPRRGLSLAWNQRSVDTFLGLPFNIASYALLLEMMAQQMNMVTLELTGFLGDTHLYSNHMKQVETQLSRDSRKLPKLKLNKAKSIFDYKYEDFEFIGYDPHPVIKAPIAI